MYCINCDRDAKWTFKTTGVSARPYCDLHLPSAYRASRYVTPYLPVAPTEVPQLDTSRLTVPESTPQVDKEVSSEPPTKVPPRKRAPRKADAPK